MAIAYNTNIVRDGLVLYLDAANIKSYPGTGTVWNDLSGNGRNGTLINGVAYSTNNSGIMSFDGVNDYVDLPNNVGYSNTVSAFGWFKSNGTPIGDHHVIFGGLELEVTIHSSGFLRTGIVTSSRFVSNHGSGLNDGNWHYVGFTFDGSTKTAFIDGINVGTLSVSGTLVNSFSNRRIGRFGSSTAYYLNGNISDVKIYSRAISAAEIQQNFNAMRGRYNV